MKDIWTYIAEIRPRMVVEIGCARGEEFGRILALSAPDVRYWAFEPDQDNYEAAMKVGGHRVTVMPYAIGAGRGWVTFHRSDSPSHHTISGSLKKPVLHLKEHPQITFKEIVKVWEVRLDAYNLEFGIVDFMWCDVQGAEDLVIEHGQQVLSRTKWFYTEYYNREMYEGQIPLEEIHKRLPGEWELVERYEFDALFLNKAFV